MGRIFHDYFNAGARWTTMPRPVLTDGSFDLSYARDTASALVGPTEPIGDPQPSAYDLGLELMMDAAQVLRLGRDLLINVAQENHRMAVDWLERHLDSRYRIHRVNRMADNHIDSMLLALSLACSSPATKDFASCCQNRCSPGSSSSRRHQTPASSRCMTTMTWS